jgi:Polysaccharide deacetylase
MAARAGSPHIGRFAFGRSGGRRVRSAVLAVRRGGVCRQSSRVGAFAGMCPRSPILGPNLRRLPQSCVSSGEIALTFDDGPDPIVTVRVLDLLDRYGAKASFFCVGSKAASYPEIVQEIVRRGHSVENHSQRHPAAFAAYGIGRLRRETEAARFADARPLFSARRWGCAILFSIRCSRASESGTFPGLGAGSIPSTEIRTPSSLASRARFPPETSWYFMTEAQRALRAGCRLSYPFCPRSLSVSRK